MSTSSNSSISRLRQIEEQLTERNMGELKEITGIAVVEGTEWTSPKKVSFKPKTVYARDIVLKVEACGVCGSDIHCAAGHWGPRNNPLVVGHEIIGRVIEVGSGCKEGLKVGDRVGVGAQALSCLECSRCESENEQYCSNMTGTYNFPYPDGYISQGGYASHVIVHEHFAIPIPDNIPSHLAAPLMCGGITAFSPLLRSNVGPGTSVGVVGIGGIGHMAVIFAKALGANVTAISRRSNKKDDALKLGADVYIAAVEDKDWHKTYANTLDLIVVCSSSLTELDFDRIPSLLKVGGKVLSIAIPEASERLVLRPLLLKGISIGTSVIGSPAEIKKLLDFVSKKNLKIWVEEVPISEAGVAEVFRRMNSGDVRYRFSLVDFDKEFGA
ncbi:NAD(P)-dependent alcohol dehydrogenase Ecym_1093 [Eremothecium cymbalariae DBVPG|uniref:alcohol dehydrogenase (NADP(+)) n=1 Tax=Eremothecium cymbalariae (strain CBS 270.75 / DBVPG 7215 / KCTC 17166 / NRRL Y-17582) TaxID=931890 RepID=G8JME0_ERECY|nr:hypothetical protein Ecym_1093 [Eremothecium cymbalariae DBVPG\